MRTSLPLPDKEGECLSRGGVTLQNITRPVDAEDFGTMTKETVASAVGAPRKGVSTRSGLMLSSQREPHDRLRAKLMRAHAILYADKDASLSPISRSELERAVSTFLKEAGL